MRLKRLKLHILLAVLLTFSLSASAAPTVKASLDSVNLLMGKMTSLHLSVSVPKGTKGSFPILSRFREDGIIPLCGDSVELRAPSKIDTVESGSMLDIRYDIPLQAFDSGYYRLPEFVFVTGRDSIRSNAVSFKVYPVNTKEDEQINDYASVADPENSSIFDAVPDWVIDFWWVILIVLIAIGLFIYVMRRYKKVGSILPKKPEPTPYEEASTALKDLKEKKLWEQGMEKEYFTELTEILRRYLYRRFGINAMEMTSRQILSSLSKNKDIADKRQYFRQILNMADFVKFAKVRPLPDDNILAYDNAVRFVEETKPVPVPEDGDGKNPASANTVRGQNSVNPVNKGINPSDEKGGGK